MVHSLSGGQLSLSAQRNIPEDKLVGENEHGSLTEMGFEEAKQNTLLFFFQYGYNHALQSIVMLSSTSHFKARIFEEKEENKHFI